MSFNEEGFIERVSIRHSVSPDAVRTILRALRSSRGRMAQFTALPVPTTLGGSSDPMYPKPFYARFRARFAVKGEVYPPPFPHTGIAVGDGRVSNGKMIRLGNT